MCEVLQEETLIIITSSHKTPPIKHLIYDHKLQRACFRLIIHATNNKSLVYHRNSNLCGVIPTDQFTNPDRGVINIYSAKWKTMPNNS